MKPEVFDRNAQKSHRRRTRPEALFLHQRICDQVKERLTEVNRAFKRIVIVTGQPAFWAGAFPEALIVADEDLLDLEVGAFDLVLHLMSLHSANDPVGQMIQSRRALVPDGLFLAAFPGGQTLSELRMSLANAEAELTGGLSPRIAPMGDIRELGSLLQRAGFALPVADLDSVQASYADMWALMLDLRYMGEANALSGRLRSFSPRRLFERAGEIYAAHFSDENRLSATFEIVFLTGWAPAETQQQPLRPGSARTRLADALRVPEISTGEPVDGLPRKGQETRD